MAKYQYRNKLKEPLVIMGIGQVGGNAIIETDVEINSPNLELLTEKTATMVGVDPVTQVKKKK